MLIPSENEVELAFSREPLRSAFPLFCNALIALEAPRTASFPILTAKEGPDGKMDGEWDLRGVDSFIPVSVAATGWNVYQFKSLDVPTLGKSAFSDLSRRVRGAVKDVIAGQTEPKPLTKYVLFTNLRLGLETETATVNERLLNAQREKLRDEILRGSAEDVEVVILDAGQISGFIARHPVLRMGWFASGHGMPWKEMGEQERRITGADVPLVGRESELMDIQGWLGTPDVRVIAVSGPNGVGKTRLVIEATRPCEAITFFAQNVHALAQEGVGSYASAERPVVLIVEDPPVDIARRLAEQAVGCKGPIKLIITLPSPEHAPIIRLGDDSAVKPRQIPRLPKELATKLVDSVNPGIANRLRDWIVQQAGGIPGVLVAAALKGEELHREAGSLRQQLSQKLKQSLEVKAGKDALPFLHALSPLVYVRIGGESPELPILLSHIAPDIKAPTILRRLGEFESLGFLRKQGEYVAVAPPMFAAGLFYELARDNPTLPEQLMASLDLAARKRLLERLVTVELPHEKPFISFVFGPDGPFGNAERFSENLELLDYLARALPEETARFLWQQLNEIWLEVVHRGQHGMEHLVGAVAELMDEPTATSRAFSILTDLAMKEASESSGAVVATHFTECFIYWYPRSISYLEREAAIESMLGSTDLSLRKLGLKAIITATNPPDTLGASSVTARRLGGKPSYGTWNDVWQFLLRMMKRRLDISLGGEAELRAMAIEKLPTTISRLSHALRIEDTMRIVSEICEPYFEGVLKLDPIELRESIRWLREYCERSGKETGSEQGRGRLNSATAELDALLIRLETGRFEHRLRMAVGRTFDYDDAIFEDRNLHKYQVRLLKLAREAASQPELMTDAAWNILAERDALNSGDFALFLGESDQTHAHVTVFLVRSTDWQWSRLLGFYFSGAATSAASWVESKLDEMLGSPESPKAALLHAIRLVGPTEANRLRLKELLQTRSVSADEVAFAFSSGRWLEALPVDEVRGILQFILSEPDHELAMTKVVSLYLHHHRPLPRGLFDLVLPVLRAPIHARMSSNYELNQIATGLATTDLDAGLELLEDAVERGSDVHSKTWWQSWNPFEGYGTRDFWEYLRTQAPQRAYAILGGWNTEASPPAQRDHGQGYLLDVQAHQDILTEIARTSLNAARIFAECLRSGQPGFFQFAYQLVAIHPNDQGVLAALSAALISISGFGYEYDRLTKECDSVSTELKSPELSETARQWLESVNDLILTRRAKSRRDFGSPDPPFQD